MKKQVGYLTKVVRALPITRETATEAKCQNCKPCYG